MDTGYKYSSPKRRRVEEYPYPPIPKSDQDKDDNCDKNYNDSFKLRSVPFTPSTEWGTGEAAKFRATNITHINDENEGLVRSHHPALSPLQNVWVSESVFGRPVWVVDSPAKEVEAAGRQVHFLPGDYSEYLPRGVLTPRSPDSFNIHFQRDINPRRFLTSSDLDSLRELFPQAVGVELLIAGFIIVLFDFISDVEDAYSRVWPLELAGLRVFFDVARYDCTTAPIESGTGLSADPSDEHHTRTGCLGLKLRLPDGSSVITTVTHGFVTCPEASKQSRIITRFRGLYDRVKMALMRCLPAYVDEQDAPYIASQGQLMNSPIGKQVWLASSNRRVGTITRTYDYPSTIKPYPSGYLHDLSLISGHTLPDVTNPSGYPLVTGWANYSTALEQQDVYVVCHQTNVGRWRSITGTADGTLFKRATVLGTGYTWNKLERSQNAFILWHTGASLSPADGWSGSPLCLGRPSEATSKAIVFQNFQRMCLLEGDSHSKEKQRALIKAGYVLPLEIRDSLILEVENHIHHRKFETTPAKGRSSNESYRRIVSGV